MVTDDPLYDQRSQQGEGPLPYWMKALVIMMGIPFVNSIVPGSIVTLFTMFGLPEPPRSKPAPTPMHVLPGPLPTEAHPTVVPVQPMITPTPMRTITSDYATDSARLRELGQKHHPTQSELREYLILDARQAVREGALPKSNYEQWTGEKMP